MNIPKRHHYLAQWYLKNFTDKEGYFWIFDRKKNEYRKQTPKNIALQINYYTFLDKDGKKNVEIENFFSIIEGKTKPIVTKINSRTPINLNEKIILATFISYQKMRVPDFEKKYNESYEKMLKKFNELITSSKEKATLFIKRYEKATGKKANITPEKLIDFIQGDRYYVKVPRGRSLQAMLNIGKDLISFFLNMDWVFLQSPKKSSFVTSDNPVILVPPGNYDPNSFDGVGIITPGAKNIIPLSQRTCLVMADYGQRILWRVANQKEVRVINLFLAINSNRLLIARDKPLLKRIVKIIKAKETPRRH